MHFSAPIVLALAWALSVMADQHHVTVTDTGYQPAQLCVKTNDCVQWIFDAGGHSVQETVAPGSCESKYTWRSIIMEAGWRWDRSFRTPGVVSYSSFVGNDCANGFKGTIYVDVPCPTASD